MKQLTRLYPYLFAVFPVIYVYSRNIVQVSFEVTLLPLVVLIVVAYGLVKIASWFLHNGEAAQLYVSGFFVWLFSYSAVRSLLMFELGGWKLYRHRYFIVLWLILLVVVFLGSRRFRFDYQRAGKFATMVASLLILFSVFNTVQHALKGGIQILREEIVSKPAVPVTIGQSDSLPDIYYIILDAYTGEPGLKKYLNIDNREFLSSLRDKGFYVAERSHSNYAWTILSIASSLNMEYLGVRPDSRNGEYLQIEGSGSEYDRIVENRVVSFLRARGY